MIVKDTDLVSLFEKILDGSSQDNIDEIGTVLHVGDTICSVMGPQNGIFGEHVKFEGGNDDEI